MLSLNNMEEKNEVQSESDGTKFAKVQFVIAPYKNKYGKRGSDYIPYGALPGTEWKATPEDIKEGRAVHVRDVEYQGATIPIYHQGFRKVVFVKNGKNHKVIMAMTSVSQDGDEYTYYPAVTMEYEQPSVKVVNDDGKEVWKRASDEHGNKILLSGWYDGIYPALKRLFTADELEKMLLQPFAEFAQSGNVVYLALKKVNFSIDDRTSFHYLPIAKYDDQSAMNVAKEAHYNGGSIIDVSNSNIVFPSADSGWSKEEWVAKGIVMVKGLKDKGKSYQEIATALKVEIAAIKDVFADDVPPALSEDEVPF